MNQVVYKTEKSLFNNIKTSIPKETLSGAFNLDKKEFEIKTRSIVPNFINKNKN